MIRRSAERSQAVSPSEEDHPLGGSRLSNRVRTGILAVVVLGAMTVASTSLSASADAGSAANGWTQVTAEPGNDLFLKNPDSSDMRDGTAIAGVEIPELPLGSGLYVANSVRTASNGVGYRGKIRIHPDGTITGFISRQDVGGETTLATQGLPGTVKPGSQVYVDVSVSGTTNVSIKLRSWIGGTPAPPWQMSVGDTGSDRITDSGEQRLLIRLSSQASRPLTIRFGMATHPAVSSTQTPSPAPTVQPSTAPTAPTPMATQTTAPIGQIGSAGAAPLGSTSYPIPQGAVFVQPGRSDTAQGRIDTPVGTIARAVSLAPSGGTIVLRAGTYHESLMMPGHKGLTVQSYPGEAVWLDGSRTISGFVASGSTWVVSGWSTRFDSSPTYSRGAPDGTSVGWQFINPSYPMAAHPDQVWINDKPLQQVRTRGDVRADTFFVDYAAGQIVLGSDPTGKTVRASDLQVAMTMTAPGTTLRGVGIRRFAPSVPDKGALRMWAPSTTAENVIVTESSTQGITLQGSGIVIKDVTSSDNGLNGFDASHADGLKMESVRAERNNRERFNPTPVSAGIKAHTSRGVIIRDSVFSNNYANGIWFDVSNYDVRLINNDVISNDTDGVILELSEKLLVVNNRIIDNKSQGLFLLDAGKARIWNNVITGSAETVRFHDSDRDASDTSSAPYGYDRRQPVPDPTVTWKVYDVEMSNNVIGNMRSGWCGVLCALNDSDSRTGSQMVRLNGNVYHRASASNPSVLVRWSAGKGQRTDYTSFSTFQRSTSQESAGREVIGSLPTSYGGLTGVPAPADIASILGVASGSTRVGPVR